MFACTYESKAIPTAIAILLAVLVPPVTATVSVLAEHIEEAFVILGGERDRINWIALLNVVGLTVVGRSMHVKNNLEGRAWMCGTGAEGSWEMDRKAD